MINIEKNTLISVILVVISLSGLIMALSIGNELEAEEYYFFENITVFNKSYASIDVPPVVTEIIIYSPSTNKEIVNISLAIYSWDYWGEYDYFLLPDESLFASAVYIDNRSVIDRFSGVSGFRLYFSNTTNPQELSIEVFGRTETVTNLIMNSLNDKGWSGLIFVLCISIPSFFGIIIFSGVGTIINIIKGFEYFSENREIRLLPIITTVFPLLLLLYGAYANILSWYLPIFFVFYYLPYIITCKFLKMRLDEFYFWISLGFTEIFVSVFLILFYRPDSPRIINEFQVYTASPLLPFIVYFILIGIITIASSITIFNKIPIKRDLKNNNNAVA
jgi:hypothetical protein